jgi:hypothetical protein
MWTADEIYAIAAAKHQDLAWRQHVVGVFGEIEKQNFLVEFHLESMRPDA